ncbi:hypothetical protein B0H16DRAFT_1717328 [Mycena metata]|uniref:Uncharacterized protein n=1 Tax=Mycena metata TaxID=1033252 RepID=A0AAD7NLZ7_9AGAR|nr:hypothetical protein B0H16DRAFT_1717328 [Mycena metata]
MPMMNSTGRDRRAEPSIFDVAFFEIIKKRVEEEGNAGGAVMGNAFNLTLFAFLLFITPILFLLGRCCGCLIPDTHSHVHHKELN